MNEVEYRLCGLDTNIFSGILRERESIGAGFLKLFPPSSAIPCFSPYTLFELRRRTEIYDDFLEFFDVYPCIILKNEEQLCEDEVAAYPFASGIQAALFGFSALNRPAGANLRDLLDQVFQDPDTLQRERDWPALQRELLEDWLELKGNFPPRGKHYDNLDAQRFVNEATVQHVKFRAPEWAEQRVRRGEKVRARGFPSVRMTLYTIFFRLYAASDHVPEPQDVFDALISTPAPYLDAVVTENFQADIYRKVQRLDPALKRVTVHTMGDLRRASATTGSV